MPRWRHPSYQSLHDPPSTDANAASNWQILWRWLELKEARLRASSWVGWTASWGAFGVLLLNAHRRRKSRFWEHRATALSINRPVWRNKKELLPIGTVYGRSFTYVEDGLGTVVSCAAEVVFLLICSWSCQNLLLFFLDGAKSLWVAIEAQEFFHLLGNPRIVLWSDDHWTLNSFQIHNFFKIINNKL